MTKLFAGFEGARLHWNGHCTLEQTEHTPETCMAHNYMQAIKHGAEGFRDTLPERYNATQRYYEARFTVPCKLIVWSLVHFDQPQDPLGHARNVARIMGPDDRLIAFNEPSVGWDVSGYHPHEALTLASDMMRHALSVNPRLKFWTCDPMHHGHDDEYRATDALMIKYGKHIETVGINYHALHATAPLRDVLRKTAERYPMHQIAITETSWHEGHELAKRNFPHLHSRRDWWNHVQQEIRQSGVRLAAVTWLPWLNMSWELNGPTWPNGWPG